jgi:hypothetical protein
MLVTDVLLVLSPGVFCVAWCSDPPPTGDLLWVGAAVAAVASLWGLLDGRWQAAVGGLVAVAMLAAMAVRLRRDGAGGDLDGAAVGLWLGRSSP